MRKSWILCLIVLMCAVVSISCGSSAPSNGSKGAKCLDAENSHGHGEAEEDTHAGEDPAAHAGEEPGAHAGEAPGAHAGEAPGAHSGLVEMTAAQREAVGLTLASAVRKPLAEVLELPGTIPEEPSSLIPVAPSQPCEMISYLVSIGDWVGKGGAVAMVRSSNGELVTLQAPRSGTVLSLPRRAGETTDSFSPAAYLADLSVLTVSLSVPLEDAMNLRVGQKIEAFHLSSKSDLHKGRITALSPRVDPETRLARVAARVDNSNGHLRLGMFLTARVYVENGRPVLSVPEESVLRVNGEETVYRPDPKDKDAFLPTQIEIGERRGGRAEILSGLKAGDSVVVKGSFYLKSAQMKSAMGDTCAH